MQHSNFEVLLQERLWLHVLLHVLGTVPSSGEGVVQLYAVVIKARIVSQTR